MNHDDEKLRALLKQWREVEPRADFSSAVWRRIRLAPTNEPVRAGLMDWLRAWSWPPAWAVAAVLVGSLILGSSVGVLTAPRRESAGRHELQFMSAGTLAGGYLKLAAATPRTIAEGGR